MDGQMNLFQFIGGEEQSGFSWDSDINEIHKRLKNFAQKHELEVSREEWKVWSHVPQYGYRMSFGLVVTREIVEEDEFWEGLNEIIKYAKSRNVDLSPFQPYFFGGSNTTTMSIFTTFIDKERQKRR